MAIVKRRLDLEQRLPYQRESPDLLEVYRYYDPGLHNARYTAISTAKSAT